MSTTGMTITFPDAQVTVLIDRDVSPVTHLAIHDDDGKAHFTDFQLNHVMAVLRDVACDLQGAR